MPPWAVKGQSHFGARNDLFQWLAAPFGSGRNAQAALVLRSRAKRGVSKDASVGGATGLANWTILRDPMLRIVPQDEAVELAPEAVGIALE